MRYALALSLALVTCLTGTASARPAAQITVYAAASLTDVFPKLDSGQKFSFAASNTLAQQIRQGAPADVFASADLANPQALHASGLCSTPRIFATNKLVVVYPKSNPGNVKTVFDLRRPGVKVVIARQGVPVGRLHAARSSATSASQPRCSPTSSARSRTCAACSQRWR